MWDKKRLTGAELRGKTLGVVGLGRIGQEVADRARAFGMDVVAHDPFISEQVAATLGVELRRRSTTSVRRADYITLHIPATAETRHLFNAARLARCKPGVRIVNTARGELIDEAALADAIERGPRRRRRPRRVRDRSRRPTGRSTSLPQVVATPHIAASTVEAQELVGIETATARARLPARRRRSATPSTSLPCRPKMQIRLRPFMTLADRLGALLVAARDRPHAWRSASATTAPLGQRRLRSARERRASPACCGRFCRAR